MNLFLNRQAYFYEMENICRLFFPHLKFEKNPDEISGDFAKCEFFSENDELFVECSVSYMNQYLSCKEICPMPNDLHEQEITMARGLYRLFSNITGISPNWGILTGVRPVKLYSSLLDDWKDQAKVQTYMNQRLLVEKEKIELCQRCYFSERQAQTYNTDNAYSLYISIPFCPTRCSYCSFVSHSIEKTKKMIPEYVDKLCVELIETAKLAQGLGLSLKTIYWGGGTPTQLEADQLDKILSTIEENFDLSNLVEHTVEGGRPDTITIEKLQVLKNHQVQRLSINPQTMHDSILEIIGRHHTSQQVLTAYHMAREAGFANINMDVIAGLPGDDYNGFCQTLNQLIDLNPENITVHTLSVKRSSYLTSRGEIATVPAVDEVEKMLDYANRTLSNGEFHPYYLYRQSKMLGNQENVGWSKTGYDCLYNIYMMNELHTVLAVGAGGVSRLKEPLGPQIERIFNYKYPYEYIERFSTVLERKQGVLAFYDKYSF